MTRLICVVGVFASQLGIEKILIMAGPTFLAIYPISTLLTILGVFKSIFQMTVFGKAAQH